MDRGIYTAASGGLYETKRLDIVANNIANVNTVGFKAQRLVGRQEEFSDTLASIIGTPPRAAADQERAPGVTGIQTLTDFSAGPVSHTGNPLNVALTEADTFFVINTPNGEEYTRAGNFTLNAEGSIVTPDGFPVIGEGGPITIADGMPSITSNGTVMANGQQVGRIRTVKFEDTSVLQRKDGARFVATGGAQGAAVEAAMVPQSVEMPNVNVVESIVEMIAAQKSFEAYSKTVETIDDLNTSSLRAASTNG